MKRFGKKIDRPLIKKRRSQAGPKGKFVRGKACSKCKRMRDYCKCDKDFRQGRVALDY